MDSIGLTHRVSDAGIYVMKLSVDDGLELVPPKKPLAQNSLRGRIRRRDARLDPVPSLSWNPTAVSLPRDIFIDQICRK